MTPSFRQHIWSYIAAFSILSLCFAVPNNPLLESPHELSMHHSSQQHSLNHLSSRITHQQHEAGSASQSSSPTSFGADFDNFFNAWISHPDPDHLLPWPAYEGGMSPSALEHSSSSLQHSGTTDWRPPHSPTTQHGNSHSPTSSHGTESSLKVKQKEGVINDTGHRPRGMNMRLYRVYQSRTGKSRYTGAARLKKNGTPEIVDALLSKDFARQDAAIERLEDSMPIRDGIRSRLLGKEADAITKIFADFHHIDYDTAKSIFNRRLRKEVADLLLDPNQFRVGAMMLQPQPKDRQIWTNELRGYLGQHKAKIQEARNFSLQSGRSTQVEKRNDPPEEGVQGGVNAKKPRSSTIAAAKTKRRQVGKGAETILPAKLISRMTVVYKSYVNCYPETAHKYIRQAIIARPQQARQLADELLSGNKQQIDAVIAIIGRPRPTTTVPQSFSSVELPATLHKQVEDVVMRIRKVNRSQAQGVIKKNLTKEIAEELQQPEKYQDALQKLLPVSKRNNRWTGKGKGVTD